MIRSWFPMEANMDVQKQKSAMPKAMDLSSFLLFEASGDSEADQNYPYPSLAMAEDDAQSCSYDSTDIPNADDDELHDIDDQGDSVDQAYSHGDDDDDEDEEEEDEEEECSSVYHQRWGGGEHNNIGMPLPLMGHQLKSTVSVDSTKEYELLNEVEKSRLFWETCLAS